MKKKKSVDITLHEKTGHNHMPINFKVSVKRHLILACVLNEKC